MSQDRLNYLAIMSIESNITKQLDYSDVKDEFANAKSRKRCFQKWIIRSYKLPIMCDSTSSLPTRV